MTIPSAGLKFTRHMEPVTSAQPEPGIVEINGKRYKITVEIQVDGKWEKIDASKLGRDLQTIAENCHRIYNATGPANACSFTVHLEQTEAPWSLTGATLGKFAERFKDASPGALVVKIEYKTAESTQAQVIELKDYTLKPEVTQELQIATQAIARFTNAIFTHREQLVNKKPLPVLETTPNPMGISEAGATQNRCASLSLAKRELASISSEDIIAKYELTTPGLAQSITDAATPEAKMQMLSEALIEKAATAIAENEEFRNPHITLQNRPCLAAIERALNEYKLNHVDFVIPVSPEEKVATYASLMRQPNFMLDLPFFLALKQPFIIINNDKVNVIGHLYSIPDAIENCDLEKVNIVHYNGVNHYQSVILSRDDQKAAMRQLIQKEIKDQIERFIPRLKAKDVQDTTKTKESTDLSELLRLYPRAKKELIDKLKRGYPQKSQQIENLTKTADNQFASDLRTAIHGPI